MQNMLRKHRGMFASASRNLSYAVIIAITVIGQFGWAIDGAAARAAASPPVQIRWFIGLGDGTSENQVAIEQQVVDDFNASQSDIVLTLEVVPLNSAVTVLNDEITAGNAPDIVGPVGWQGANEFHGQWLDLSSLSGWASYDTSQFPTNLLNWYNTDEGQVALPFALYPSAIFYNPALFDAAGLNYPPAQYGDPYILDSTPQTWDWDTLQQVSKRLTLDNNGKNASEVGFDPNNIVQYGFSFGWENSPAYWGSFWQSGTMLGGSPGSYTAQAPNAWKAAWQWVHDGMWGSQPFIPNGPAANSDLLNNSNVFDSGKVAMLENPIWYLCCMDNLTGGGGTFQLGAMPSYNGQVAGRIDADTLRILAASQHPDEAFTALQYLVGPGVDTLIAGQPPAYWVIPAIQSKQQAVIDQKAAQFPFVTQASWDVMLAGLDYPDDPSAEGYMPNFNDAQNRLQSFSNEINNVACLNVSTETAQLEADMQAIFNDGHLISGNAGVAGATLSYNDGGSKAVTANCAGDYSLPVSDNWSGTVTPSKTNYTFTPATRQYTNLLSDQTAQDYAITVALNAIFPTTKIAGDGDFTLILNGENFRIDSTVLWNGTDLTTTYVSPTELTAPVPAGYILNPGSAEVAVRDGPPGGDVTTPMLFTIIAPANNTWMAHSPEGGWINDLAIDPGNPSTLYVGSAHSGAFKSVDGGESWSPINNGLTSSSVNSIAVSPANSSVLLAGVANMGLYRSSNGGAFWSRVLPTWAEDVAFDPQNPQIAYAAAGNLYKSTDGGLNWTLLANQDFLDGGGVHELALDPLHSGTLYVKLNSSNTIWKSTNAGDTWSALNNGLPADVNIRSLAISPSDPDILYAGTKYQSNQLGEVGLYKSSDGGASWTKVSGSATDYIKVAVDPQDSDVLYVATSGGVLRSADGGVTLNAGLNQLAFALVINPLSTSVVYAGGFKDVYRSENAGANWQPIHRGLHAQFITTLVYDPQNTNTLFAGMWTGGVWRSSDAGVNWEQLNADEIYLRQMAIDPHNADHLYYANTGSIVESQDGGTTWGPYLTGASITFAPNSDLYMGVDDGVKKSTDGGVTWTDKSNGLPAANPVMGLVVDPSDLNIVYAFNTTALYKSVNGGDNWTLIKTNPSILSVSCYVNGRACLAIDPLNTSTLYLVEGITQGPLLSKSLDGGATWTAINTHQNIYEINTVAVDPTYDAVVYLGTDNGAFVSKDGGQTWEGFNTGLGSLLVHALLPLPQTSGPSAGVHATSTLSKKLSIAGGTVYAYSGNPILPTFISAGAYDGWVLESSSTSQIGGKLNSSATTFNLGDNKAKKQYRGILSFKTGAALPDNAVITSVTLKVKRQGVVGGGNPVNIFNGFMVDIKKGFFGKKATLQLGDFQAKANKTVGPFKPSLVGGWYSINLTSAKAYINKLSTGGGLTQIRLRFKLGDNNNTVANYLKLFSGNAPAASRPQLVITYYVP